MNKITTLVFSLTMMLGAYSAQAIETKITYYVPDALGSPIAAMDEQGNVKWRKHYRPYGEEIEQDAASKDNRIGYTGHAHDRDTGLTYMGARHYDPLIGRFMGMDPAGVDPNDPRTFNRYAYANNNPYKYVDPDGRNSKLFEWSGKVGWAIGEAINATAYHLAGITLSTMLVDVAWNALHNEEADNGDAAGESGTCPTCGGKTEDKENKIAKDAGMSVKDVGDKIHEVKKHIPKSSTIKNPDVEVCSTCGEVFPKTPNNGLGDSIGNIHD